MTYREAILQILENPKTTLTCNEICKQLIKKGLVKETSLHYLNAGISSKLNKLVKTKFL